MSTTMNPIPSEQVTRPVWDSEAATLPSGVPALVDVAVDSQTVSNTVTVALAATPMTVACVPPTPATPIMVTGTAADTTGVDDSMTVPDTTVVTLPATTMTVTGAGLPVQPTSPVDALADFEVGLVRAVVGDTQLMERLSQQMEPEDLSCAACRAIYGTAARYHADTGHLMTADSLTVELRAALQRGELSPEPDPTRLTDVLNLIRSGPGDVTYYAHQVGDYLFRQRYARDCASTLTTPGTATEQIVQAIEHAAELATLRGTTMLDRFPEWRLQDLQGYAPDPADILAGTGWLRRGSGTLLTGGTGLGKSILALQVAVSCSAGIDLLGKIKVPRPVSVLVLQAENAVDVMKRDVLSLVSHLNADPATVQRNLVVRHLYGLSGRAFTTELAPLLTMHRPDLLVIDPYQAYAGGTDLNGSHGFLEWIGPVEQAIRRARCALLLVCHTGKPRSQNLNARETAYLATGTSTLPNWARSSMELVPVQQETDRFRLTFGKGAEQTGIQMPDQDGPVRQLFVQHSADHQNPYWLISDNQSPPGESGYEGAVQDYVDQHPKATTREVAAAVGCSQATAARLMRKLKAEESAEKAPRAPDEQCL